MKYLFFKSKGIAIPLEALQACGNLRFVDSTYVTDKATDKSDYVYYDANMSSYYAREAVVIDDKDILAEKPKEAE